MAKSRVLKTQENRLTRGFGNGHSGVDLGWQTTQTDAVLAHSDGTVTFCQTGYSINQGLLGERLLRQLCQAASQRIQHAVCAPERCDGEAGAKREEGSADREYGKYGKQLWDAPSL